MLIKLSQSWNDNFETSKTLALSSYGILLQHYHPLIKNETQNYPRYIDMIPLKHFQH